MRPPDCPTFSWRARIKAGKCESATRPEPRAPLPLLTIDNFAALPSHPNLVHALTLVIEIGCVASASYLRLQFLSSKFDGRDLSTKAGGRAILDDT